MNKICLGLVFIVIVFLAAMSIKFKMEADQMRQSISDIRFDIISVDKKVNTCAINIETVGDEVDSIRSLIGDDEK